MSCQAWTASSPCPQCSPWALHLVTILCPSLISNQLRGPGAILCSKSKAPCAPKQHFLCLSVDLCQILSLEMGVCVLECKQHVGVVEGRLQSWQRI